MTAVLHTTERIMEFAIVRLTYVWILIYWFIPIILILKKTHVHKINSIYNSNYPQL